MRSHCAPASRSSTELFSASDGTSPVGDREVNHHGDGNISDRPPRRTPVSSPVNHAWTPAAHDASPGGGPAAARRHSKLLPTTRSSRLPQGPRQSNTEDICCVVRPPSCEQVRSSALFPFSSSSFSSYQAFSTCCFHHSSYCRGAFSMRCSLQQQPK